MVLKRSRLAMFSSLVLLIIFSLLLGGLVTTVVAADTGELAFDKELVSWVVGSEPGNLKFDLEVNITDVTDLKAVVFSVEWAPTYLDVPSYTPGDFLPLGMPEATGWMITWDKPAGKMKEAANTFMAGYGPTSVSKPSWGWVMTLVFEFVGTPPAAGSPIDTEIRIVKYPEASMDTKWKDSGNAYHDFDKLSDPYVHACHFHYEAEAALAAVHLESEEDTAASTNLGRITFDGASYSLPDDVSKAAGTYQAQYFADAGYLFDRWETSGLVSISDANANPATVTVSGDGALKTIYREVTVPSSHHDDHLSDDYAPMVIPFKGESLTIAPVITCTILENDVFKLFHHLCKSAQTTLTDDDWTDGDANYTYVFEDWTDYDWNDIVVSLYAVVNDVVTVEFRLVDREAAWKSPFGVGITLVGMDVWVHWNSTDYPEEHIVRVNSSEPEDIELFFESNPGDNAFITIIPIIPPTYTLTITSTSGGTTDPVPDSYSYDEGTVVSIAAIPDSGYILDHWELDGVDVGSANPIDVTINTNHTLHAVFKEVLPPPPVGGRATPIDKPDLLIPKIGLTARIGLASVLLAVVAATVILIRRKKRH